MIWQTLIVLVISVVLTELLRPKPKVEDARAAGLGDFKFPTATEGRVIPIVWGRVMIEGLNVVWYGNLSSLAIKKKIKKNLWSHFYATTGYQYKLGIQGVLCRGQLDAILGFWVGDQQVWDGSLSADGVILIDEPELFGGNEVGTGGIQMDLQCYMGGTGQTPNDYLYWFQARKVGTTHVQPSYDGNAYFVARHPGSSAVSLDPSGLLPRQQLYIQYGLSSLGAYIGNSETLKPWKFEVRRYAPAMPGQPANQYKIGQDSNCANVLYEILTNTEWGCQISALDIDLPSFLAAATTLATENNGWGYVLAKDTEAGELVAEIQRQIDGVVFLDHLSGKWKLKLVRADYVLASQPLVDEDNTLEVQDYIRGTWRETINQVQVEFENRSNAYAIANALTQDTANMLMQGGGNFSTLKVVPAKLKFPGVKTAALAQKIASRELIARSFPLVRATVVLTRALYTVTIGSVVRFSNASLGVNQLAMRVTKVDFGTVNRNAMTLWLVQDVFATLDGVFGDPPTTIWEYPAVELNEYDTDSQLAFEAPRGVVVRDPEYAGDPTLGKIMVAAAVEGSAVSARIDQRSAAGTPSGAFTTIGRLASFAPVGVLTNNLPGGSANPLNTLTVSPFLTNQSDLLDAFGEDVSTLAEMGTELAGLIMINNEFMLVRSAQASGANVVFQTVYRGVLDSAQASHLAGDQVWLLFAGSNLTEGSIPNTYNVEVELRKESESETFAGAVTSIDFAMDKRALRPYAPGAFLYNGSGTAFTTPSLEGAGSGIGGFRIDVAWWRRRYDTADEVQELLQDNSVDASTEYELTVRADPNGANTLVSTSAWTTGSGPLAVSRADILTAAMAGTLLRFSMRSRHDILTETNLTSRNSLVHDVTPTSALSGLFYLGGGLAVNVASASYTALATGSYTAAIGSAQSTALIEVSLNGGAWATAIGAGLTSGTFAVTAGDTIRLRRTVNEAPQPNYVELRNPSSTVVAYGTFKN